MKRFQNIPLLTKATLAYVAVTLLAFLAYAWFLRTETNEMIDHAVGRKFSHVEYHLNRQLAKGVPVDSIRSRSPIIKVSADTNQVPEATFSDTVVFDHYIGREAKFRKKTIYFSAHGAVYKTDVLREVEGFYWLRDDIFQILIPAFLSLLLAVAIANHFLSKSLYRPFNSILKQMLAFDLNKPELPQGVHTSTKEFKNMQVLFQAMTKQISKDYQNLKEYTEDMAHEMQTPLAVIRNKADKLMNNETVMAQSAQEVKSIYEATNFLSKLGETLNLITKIENKEFAANAEINTKPAIEKHVGYVSEQLEMKGLHMTLNLDEKQSIKMHPELLDILISNLLKNAIRHGSQEGGINIHTEGDKLVFSNPGGPLPFDKAEIFRRFYKSQEDRKSLGLGLAVAQKICETSGLKIHYSYNSGLHSFTIQPN